MQGAVVEKGPHVPVAIANIGEGPEGGATWGESSSMVALIGGPRESGE